MSKFMPIILQTASRIIILAALMLYSLLGEVLAVGDMKFKQLSVDQGLSQSTVFAIAQDHKRNIWMGTSDGLNKYDGYSFTVYRHISGDNKSINDNSISSLFVDNDGRIWIGTSSGLSCYDYAQDKFENFSLPGHNVQISDIVETEDGNKLLLASDVGVLIFDKKNKQLEIRSYLSGVTVHSLCRFRSDILIGTSNGLYSYSTTLGTIEKVMPELDKYDIASIIYQQDKGCWIATYGNGVFCTDKDLRITRQYNTSNSNGLTSNYIRVLKSDNSGKVWIGTFNGLFVYNPVSDRFISYRYAYDEDTSIAHNSIRSIFMDNQGGVWLGTYYGGVSYYHPLAFKFNLIQYRPSRNSLADNTVSCIVEEPTTGNLWIGTNDMGINYYNIVTGEFVLFSAKDDDNSLHSNNIKCVLPDGGDIWIGTHAGGLSRLNRSARSVRTYNINAAIPINNSCYSLLDQSDKLWVGTLNGLYLFDKKTGEFSAHRLAVKHQSLSSSIINTLFRDSQSRIWIGTNSGIYTYLPSEDKLISYQDANFGTDSMAHKPHVTCITEDSRGGIWIGTKQGFYMFDDKNGAFKGYTTDNGLPNNFVYGILEDDLHRLWISTNKGLSCFDPATQIFRNYTKSDGISSDQFNVYSYCKTRAKVFYFGGINGITYFKPNGLTDNPFTPKTEITGFTIFNKEIDSESKAQLTRDSQGTLTEVKFPSEMNLFSVKYVVTNPLAGERNQFAYMLEGFDTQWYYTRNLEVNYSNLSPGHYIFKVKACNNDGKWCDEATEFSIKITPMWYQTALAKILLLLLLGLIAFMAIRFYLIRAKMRVQLYLERMEKRKIEELSQDKIRFYVNMSHELRTPLTLILSPLQEMKNHGIDDKYIEKRVDYVRKNSVKLLHIVNQLLDYRKAELGMLKTNVAMTDVDSVVANIFSMFEDSAQNRDMDFILSSTLNNTLYPIDRMYLEMIITNLLSNAFKFTPDGGMIKVALDRVGDRLVISVRDSGIGVATDKQNKIFDRFYQVDEGHSGTGIGLSIVKRLVELHHGAIRLESEPEKFTEFIVSLPAEISAYNEDELAAENEIVGTKIKDVSLFVQDGYTYEEQSVDDTDSEDKEETILIVEDNKEIRKYLVDNFREKFNIHTAPDAEKALLMLKSIVPDIIITDIMMPGTVDGVALCRTVKQNIRTSHIPVIILTAKDGLEDQIKGIEAGADDYLTKPFSVSVLNAKIANLLKAKYRLLHHYSDSVEVDPDKITSNSVDGEFLKKAIKIVEDNMDNEEFSSNDFCRELCMSRSNLHLKIKSITGESSTQFIRKIRFNRACKLLLEGKYSIAEISSMVGFNSPSYFATSFKKHMGCLPTEYVKNKRAGTGHERPAEDKADI